MSCVSVALALFPVVDPDLQIKGGGGGAHNQTRRKGGEPEIKNIFFGPSGLSLV